MIRPMGRYSDPLSLRYSDNNRNSRRVRVNSIGFIRVIIDESISTIYL